MAKIRKTGCRLAVGPWCATLLVGTIVGIAPGDSVRAEESAFIGRRPPAIAQPLPMPPLVRETQAHFETSYWRDPTEKQRRLTQLNEVTAAWRTATKNESNNRRLHVWLRMAIQNSMPGSREPLPPVPSFERPWTPTQAEVARQAREDKEAEAIPPETSSAGASGARHAVAGWAQREDNAAASDDGESFADPFRDDP